MNRYKLLSLCSHLDLESSTVSFSVGFFVVAVAVFSYSLTCSLHSFRVMNPDLRSRARRDSSLGVVRDGGKSCLIWGSFPVGIQTRR